MAGIARLRNKMEACAVGELPANNTPAQWAGKAETSEGNNSSATIMLPGGMVKARRC